MDFDDVEIDMESKSTGGFFGAITLAKAKIKEHKKVVGEIHQQNMTKLMAHKKAVDDSWEAPSFRKFVEKKLGYPLEKHVYYTKDGYINTVFRIPGPKGTKPL